MAKEKNGEDEFGFGHGRSGADVFDAQHDFDRWEDNNKVNWSRPGESSYAEEQWDKQNYRNFAANRARSAATGAWVSRANEHAATLYNEDNMDYNDMKKYAGMAGVKDINSENDVAAIREAYNNAHTTNDELTSAIDAMRDEMTESKAGGEAEASRGMSYNDYLEQADADSEGTGGAEAASKMLSNNVKSIAADKQLVGKGKANQGKYVLENLGSDKFEGGTGNV